MSKNWLFSVLAIGGAALGFVLSGSGVSANVNSPAPTPGTSFAMSRPRAVRPLVARLDMTSLAATRTPARYRAAVQDGFIRTFAAPRAYPRLSQLNMNLYSTVSGLPRYAPGADPVEKVKADRDQHGTRLGSLFISDRGLTLNLF